MDQSLAEIGALIATLPPWEDATDARVSLGEPSFGLLDGLAAWIAAGQRREIARLDRPRAAVFFGNWPAGDAGDGGVALAALQSGDARLNGLCRLHDAELRVYEMTVDGGGAALSPEACATAMAYGMTAVEDGLDLLCVSAVGAGCDRAAADLAVAVAGVADTDGTEGRVGAALAALAHHGGHALSALAGALIAARMARVPVLLDGFAALAAAGVLQAGNAGALDHCVLAQQLDGTAARRLQEWLSKEAVLDLGIDGGDGCAALLVLGLLRATLGDGAEG